MTASAAGEMAVLGTVDAPVIILEFSDFQCPYCRRHALQTMPLLKKYYIDTGKVRYEVHDYPLPSHPNAHKAAEAARCAGAQGAYWEMYERLFRFQGEWSRQKEVKAISTFVRYADDLGLDRQAFRDCVASGQSAEQIARDLRKGRQVGVGGTPSFLIRGRLLEGAYEFGVFQRIIEAELEK